MIDQRVKFEATADCDDINVIWNHGDAFDCFLVTIFNRYYPFDFYQQLEEAIQYSLPHTRVLSGMFIPATCLQFVCTALLIISFFIWIHAHFWLQLVFRNNSSAGIRLRFLLYYNGLGHMVFNLIPPTLFPLRSQMDPWILEHCQQQLQTWVGHFLTMSIIGITYMYSDFLTFQIDDNGAGDASAWALFVWRYIWPVGQVGCALTQLTIRPHELHKGLNWTRHYHLLAGSIWISLGVFTIPLLPIFGMTGMSLTMRVTMGTMYFFQYIALLSYAVMIYNDHHYLWGFIKRALVIWSMYFWVSLILIICIFSVNIPEFL